jgi:hypothetical protein
LRPCGSRSGRLGERLAAREEVREAADERVAAPVVSLDSTGTAGSSIDSHERLTGGLTHVTCTDAWESSPRWGTHPLSG